jgi:hypothetical protein
LLYGAYYAPMADEMAKFMEKFNGSAYPADKAPGMAWYLILSLVQALIIALVVFPRQVRLGGAFAWGAITGLLMGIATNFGWVMTFPFVELPWIAIECVVAGIISGLVAIVMQFIYNRMGSTTA